MSVKGVRREFGQLEKALGHTTKRLNGLEREAEKVARAYNREEKQLNNLRSKANDLRSSAAGSFNNDPFGGGASGLMLQLKADTNDARSMSASAADVAAQAHLLRSRRGTRRIR
jgi:hypothetical protein